MSATTKVTYQGKRLNSLTVEIIEAAEVLLKYKKGSLTIVQGSYNGGGVQASAGTHDGGGALDLTASDWTKKEKIFRLLGCAAWKRPTLPGVWSSHLHLIVDGDTTASRGAKQQVSAYRSRRNGLANNGADQGYRMSVFPQFVYGAAKQRWTAVRTTQGYSQPIANSKFKKIGTSRKAGYNWSAANVATVRVAGEDWLVTKSATFYKKKDFKKYVAPVAVKPTTKPLTLSVGTINVIRWRLGEKNARGVTSFKIGLDYNERVKGFAQMQDAMGVSVFTTTESGQYADADRLTSALGKSEWNNVLHGDNAGDITSAVHWHRKRKELETGSFSTGTPSEVAYHDMATWALLKDTTGSNAIFLVVGYHAEYRARGTTSASAYDKLREKHTKSLITQAEGIAKAAGKTYRVRTVPIVFAGDFNQDLDDYYDGPGKAMAAAGYVDSESVALKMAGPSTTYNDLNPKKTTGRRLDRIFIKKGTVVSELRTVVGNPYSDHNGVAAAITIKN